MLPRNLASASLAKSLIRPVEQSTCRPHWLVAVSAREIHLAIVVKTEEKSAMSSLLRLRLRRINRLGHSAVSAPTGFRHCLGTS